jgi:hypothetical protein
LILLNAGLDWIANFHQILVWATARQGLAPSTFSGAFTRFFPGDNGLTSDVTSSAHQTTPAMQLQQGLDFGAAVIH